MALSYLAMPYTTAAAGARRTKRSFTATSSDAVVISDLDAPELIFNVPLSTKDVPAKVKSCKMDHQTETILMLSLLMVTPLMMPKQMKHIQRCVEL